MDRRKFLKDSAAAAAAGMAMTFPSFEGKAFNSDGKAGTGKDAPGMDVACDLKFRKDGKFKVLQLTDTHYIWEDPRSDRAMENVCAVLDYEKPDFVIHTGDIVFGTPAEKSARAILQPLVDRGIPFAVAMGNHDSDFDLTRTEMYKVLRSVKGNVNTPDDKGISGCSNDIITISGSKGVDRVLYLFDSGNRAEVGGVSGWGYVHQDQVAWYKNHSRSFTKANGGKPVPSVGFFHIPVPEYM